MDWHPLTPWLYGLLFIVGVVKWFYEHDAKLTARWMWGGIGWTLGLSYTYTGGLPPDPEMQVPNGLRSVRSVELGCGLLTMRIVWFGNVPRASPTGCTGTPPASIDEHPCVDASRGWLRVSNLSTNPYQVTITGPSAIEPFELPGGYMMDSIYVGTGSYGIHALQLSGYVFTPSEFNGTRTVPLCNKVSWSFP